MRIFLLHLLLLLGGMGNYLFANPICSELPENLPGLIYLGEYEGSVYYCSDSNNHDWSEATAANAATAYGGYLVVVNSAGENDFLASNIMADRIWIGLTDENWEGEFEWVNGDPVTYTNWAYYEPNDQGVNGGHADYTVLEKWSGEWKDRNGDDWYEYVIEVPCDGNAQPTCDGQITSAIFYNLNGGPSTVIADGGTYNLNELPSSFNIEAIATGEIESITFSLSGAITDDHLENYVPYRFGGDNTPMDLIPGDYILTLNGFSNDWADGVSCDEKTLSFTIAQNSQTCNITCSRDVSSTTSCGGNGPYTIWLQNADGGNYFDGSGEAWEECEDGTIHYYGTAYHTQGPTDDDFIVFDLYFSDKTTDTPPDSPKPNACNAYDASDWLYYTSTTGTITSVNHGTFYVERAGPSFQLGDGANQQSAGYGASGWMTLDGGDGEYSNGDVNVLLSNNCNPCDNNNFDLVCEKNIDDGGWEIDGNCIVKVCEGAKVVLSVNPNGLPTSWTGPNGFEANTNDILISESVTADDAGFYEATVDNNGCLKTQAIQLKVMAAPDVDVDHEDPTCDGGDGSITFYFDDTAGRSNIEFSLDGGDTYPLNVADDEGSATFWDLPEGEYDVYVRWGNNDCAVGLGTVELTAPDISECDPCEVYDFDLVCEKNIDDGGWEIDGNCIVKVCEGAKVVLSVNPNGLPTSWIGPNGFEANTNDILISESVTAGDAGFYEATVDNNGCLKTQAIRLKVMAAPDVDVDHEDPTCDGGDGSITFYFDDTAGRSNIEFSLDGGDTYPLNVHDDEGSATFWDLPEGEYDVYVRWGNDQCPVDLGVLVLLAPADTDGDGICDDEDCAPQNENLPAAPGTACNDNDPNTVNDLILDDGCTCAGTPVPVCDNVQIGGTIGFLNSCSPTIVYCNLSGDAPLIQDCISPIGGSGALDVVWLQSTTSCLPPTTNIDDIMAGNDPHWTIIAGANGLSYQPGVLTESTCFLRCSRRENCSVYIESNIVHIELNCNINFDCGSVDISTINNVIQVSGIDDAPISSVQVFSTDYATTYFTCAGDCDVPVQYIPVGEGDYIVYVKLYDGGYNLVCEVFGTYHVPPCDNVQLGGFIGFGNCLGNVTHCPADGPAPVIADCGSPEGGTGILDIVWLQSTTSCLPPTTTFAEIAAGNDPHWTMIAGANGLSYDPGNVTENTCYLRCSRMMGCDTYIESNIISLVIDPACIPDDPTRGRISGLVWNDQSGDGIQDRQEKAMAGVWVTLFNLDGTTAGAVQTDALGKYTFFNLVPGQFRVQFATPAGFEVTLQNVGTDDTIDSDISPLDGSTAWLTVNAGDHLTNENAGFKPATQNLIGRQSSFDFEVEQGEEFVALYFAHNDGKNVDNYAIERSANGSEYEEISLLPSKGGRDAELYSDVDFAPATGDNYYRVKFYFKDGTVGYSEAKLVYFADLIDFVLFPNPASDFIKVNLETMIGKKVELKIINNYGVMAKLIGIDEVYSKYYQVDLRDLHEGRYVLWVQSPEHKAVAKQFIIGKP